ncbi:MAG: DVU_1557 family redox protein [Bacillota bacterium]|jgi:DNA-directed RNA polymerase subunit RPC12/RpoP
MADGKYICSKCKVEMVMKNIKLNYLGHNATHDFLACPQCGNLYIPEDIVLSKMLKVETELEDK